MDSSSGPGQRSRYANWRLKLRHANNPKSELPGLLNCEINRGDTQNTLKKALWRSGRTQKNFFNFGPIWSKSHAWFHPISIIPPSPRMSFRKPERNRTHRANSPFACGDLILVTDAERMPPYCQSKQELRRKILSFTWDSIFLRSVEWTGSVQFMENACSAGFSLVKLFCFILLD
jgi:hypothetical protein